PHSSISTPPRADTSPLSLHDALPICSPPGRVARTQDRARHVRAATSSGRRGSRRARSCSSPRVPPPDSSQRWSFCTPEELGDSLGEGDRVLVLCAVRGVLDHGATGTDRLGLCLVATEGPGVIVLAVD